MLGCLDTTICLLRCKVAKKCGHEYFGMICCATADHRMLMIVKTRDGTVNLDRHIWKKIIGEHIHVNVH